MRISPPPCKGPEKSAIVSGAYEYICGPHHYLLIVYNQVADSLVSRPRWGKCTCIDYYDNTWNVVTSCELFTLLYFPWCHRSEREVGGMESAHDSFIWSLSWHPLGHILCSGSNDHTRYLSFSISFFFLLSFVLQLLCWWVRTFIERAVSNSFVCSCSWPQFYRLQGKLWVCNTLTLTLSI